MIESLKCQFVVTTSTFVLLLVLLVQTWVVYELRKLTSFGRFHVQSTQPMGPVEVSNDRQSTSHDDEKTMSTIAPINPVRTKDALRSEFNEILARLKSGGDSDIDAAVQFNNFLYRKEVSSDLRRDFLRQFTDVFGNAETSHEEGQDDTSEYPL